MFTEDTEVVVFDLWDWTKLEDEDIGDLFSEVFHVVGFSINNEGSNVGVDGINVRKSVGEHNLEKFDWVLEDGRPSFDSHKIWSHGGAVSEVTFDSSEHLSNNSDGLNDIHDIFLFEVIDGFNKHWGKNFLILEADFDVIEVVFLDKSVKETINEFGNSIWWEWKSLNLSSL